MEQFPFKNIIVQFDLPYVLRVVDSIKKETTPEDYEDYISVINDCPVMLRFEKKVREHGGIAMSLEDRRGLLSYSKVQVWFDKTYFRALGIIDDWTPQTQTFIDLSIAHVNHFTGLYRVVIDAHWIRPITRVDIKSYSFAVNPWDGPAQQHPHLIGQLGTGVALGKLLPDEVDTEIRDYLVSGRRYDDLKTFFQVVFDMFDKSEYWATVLSASIYFESTFARYVRGYFLSKGEIDDAIDMRFQKKKGEYYSITKLLIDNLPEMTGVDVMQESDHPLRIAFNEWKAKSRNLRNDVAHGKAIVVSRKEAMECMQAVKLFLERIQEYMKMDITTAMGSPPNSFIE